MKILTGITTGPLMRRLQRVVQLRRTRGNARVCYAILCRIAAKPLLKHVLQVCAVEYWRQPLDDAIPLPGPSPLFTVRFAQPEDVPELIEYFGNRRRVEARLARGDRCVIATSKKSIGAAVWLALGPNRFLDDWNELRCAFRFPDRIAWSYDGKGTKLGAWGTMMKQLPEILRGAKVREIGTAIDCDNWQSIDAHRSLGYVSAGVLLHARVLGLSIQFFKPYRRLPRRIPTAVGRVQIVK